MTQQEKKEYSTNTLKRIDEWIVDCDLKTSILMAFTSVIITFIFTSEYIIKTLVIIFKDFIEYWRMHTGVFCFSRLIIIGFFITAYVFFIDGLYSLYLVLKAKTKATDITSQNGIMSDSFTYFNHIQSINYLDYKNKIDNMSEEELTEDYLSQIYINSVRAEEKFNCYNKALKRILIGLFFLISFILLVVIENSK